MKPDEPKPSGDSSETGAASSPPSTSYIPQQYGRFSDTSVIHTVSRCPERASNEKKVVESKDAGKAGKSGSGKESDAAAGGDGGRQVASTEYRPNEYGSINFSSPVVQTYSRSVSGRSKCEVTDTSKKKDGEESKSDGGEEEK